MYFFVPQNQKNLAPITILNVRQFNATLKTLGVKYDHVASGFYTLGPWLYMLFGLSANSGTCTHTPMKSHWNAIINVCMNTVLNIPFSP